MSMIRNLQRQETKLELAGTFLDEEVGTSGESPRIDCAPGLGLIYIDYLKKKGQMVPACRWDAGTVEVTNKC